MSNLNDQDHNEEDLPNDYSDGVRALWPLPPYSPSNDERFRSTLCKDWYYHDGHDIKGFNRRFKTLPSGYALFEVPKPDSSSVVYKRVFGHPSRRFFDSTKAFFPHFKWLMGKGDGWCLCKLCLKGELAERTNGRPRPRGRPRLSNSHRKDSFPKITSGQSRPRGRPRLSNSHQRDSSSESTTSNDACGPIGRRRPRTEESIPVDEEGTPDLFRVLVQRVERGVRVNEVIKEKQSMDWRAERPLLPEVLGRISLQHSFLPRVGELVLWTPETKGELVLNEDTGRYQLYSFDTEKYLDYPSWRAGTITQVPIEADDFQDLIRTPDKEKSLNLSGYRIEAMPDPNNSTNKNLSKHYQYVPLRQIRPLAFWQLLLHGLEEDHLHPSIKHALTMLSTVSLLQKWKFRGEGSEAEIFCKGVYLGAELLTVGDVIRILPDTPSETCADILVITSIRLRLHDITSGSSTLAPRTSVHFYGHAYTTTASRSYYKDFGDSQLLTADDIARQFPIVGIAKVGPLYRLHPTSNRMEISFDRVLGRLHEPAATCLWLNLSTSSTPSTTILSYDVSAIQTGRVYASQTDSRIPEGRSWFLADSRVEALALETFNGREVGAYDDAIRTEKTLRAWRANLRILDGEATQEDYQEIVAATITPNPDVKKRGRKVGGRVVNGKVIYPGQPGYEEAVSRGAKTTPGATQSKMVQASLRDSDDEGDDDEDEDDGEVIGESIEVMMTTPEDEETTEEEFLPPHVERGGTEETEGGDYEPTQGTPIGGERPGKRPRF